MKCLNFRFVIAFVIASISFILMAIKTNAQWSELGGSNSLHANAAISSVAVDAAGNVYAAGAFSDSNSYKYVAKWDGKSWTELGGLINGLANNGDIATVVTDSNNLYVAGDFFSGNNTYVAKWNGSTWSAVGLNSLAANNAIYSIAKDNAGNLYAAGAFTNSTSANNGYAYVAKWNGSTWSEMGGDTDLPTNAFNEHYIYSIATDAKGNVYAAGAFYNGSGKYYVAKWDGSVWSELGGTNSLAANNVIYSITTDAAGNVYAAGAFTDGNGNSYVAKYNGSSWQELSGLNSNSGLGIYSITTDKVGNVYATGYSNATGRSFVGEWDGSTWSTLGTGNNFNGGVINSIACDANGDVYAGGGFENAENNYYVSKYTPTGLPVTLASITATQQNKDVAIDWQTATELNTSHFNVQHSTDGVSFTDIGTVKAIGSGANKYGFIDNNPADGINYYRLQIVDMDGAATYSKVVSCELSVVSKQITVYPNPSRDNVTISGSHISSLQVIDNIGRVVKVVSLKDATNPSLSVSGLPAGVYHLRVQTSDGSMSGVGFVKE